MGVGEGGGESERGDDGVRESDGERGGEDRAGGGSVSRITGDGDLLSSLPSERSKDPPMMVESSSPSSNSFTDG